MKNIFSLMFLCLFLVACNKSGGDDSSGSSSETVAVATESDNTSGENTSPGSNDTDDSDTALPNEAFQFETNITFINMTATQKQKFEDALEIIRKVVATDEFREAVLNHTYNGSKTFVDNRGYSNSKIYQTILDAAEKLQPAKNNTMDMEVELYYANNNVVGYTNGSTKRIWVNTKFFNTNPLTSVASNLFHEWLHKLGYGHAVNYSTSRDYSVPYAIGRIVGRLGKDFL